MTDDRPAREDELAWNIEGLFHKREHYADDHNKIRDILIQFADEIRAEAAEKAKAAFNKWAMNRITTDKYKLVEGRVMIDSAITGREK